jgi:replicative DNA helicase
MATKPEPPNPPATPPPARSPSPALERLLPLDLDAERAALGSMLQEKEAIGEVINVLRDAGALTFTRESHQQLYEVLVKIFVSGQPVDGVVIKDELQRRGLWEKLGGFDYLAGLLGAVPSALRAAHYAGIVYDKYLLRQLIAATHRVMEKALDNDQPARDVLDYADKEIFNVTEKRVTGEAQELAHLIREAFQTIQDRGNDGTFTGEPTGFRELDELTNGFQPGELVIIAGRPSMGKTALGLNMAEHMAIVERRPVVFFSLEMSRQQLAQRILCSRARVNAHLLRRGRHSGEDMQRLQQVAEDLADAPLLVDDSSDLTILELRARSRMAARRQKIRAIFVDYLQLMRSPRSENRQVEVATISRGLKALAKDLNVPVVAMAQLNRSPEDKTRRGNRPRMSDLRESGAIEQDADVIALLHRESYYKTREARVNLANEMEAASDFEDPDENVAELIIAKQRNGPVDTIRLHFSREYTRFDNHMPGGVPQQYIPPDSPQTPF